MDSTAICSFPASAGVYLFKDARGAPIYIGKAKSLRIRVASYFRTDRADWKVRAMLAEAADVSYVATKTEHEALALEAQLVNQHQPKFNVLLKGGQPFVYLLFTTPTKKKSFSELKVVRNRRQKGTHFGPFLNKQQARRVYAYLIKTFRLHRCAKSIANGCLQYHLGICAGSCLPDFDEQGYAVRIKLAQQALRSNHQAYLKTIQEQVKIYSDQLAFEKARQLAGYAENLESIFAAIAAKYRDERYAPAVNFVTQEQTRKAYDPRMAVEQLQDLLKLERMPTSIDCFDVSHFQGSSIVGSCVRFVNGMPDTRYCRRFRIKTLDGQDDYAALHEIVSRRYKSAHDWPDLILIDGGKGQLSAVRSLVPDVAMIALAKREERIFGTGLARDGVRLDLHTHAGKLLIALRDYAHHFAISYHRFKRSQATARFG